MQRFSIVRTSLLNPLFLIFACYLFITSSTTVVSAQVETITSDTFTASGGTKYHYTLDLTSDNWNRGNDYGITVKLVVESWGQSYGIGGSLELILDLHDISIKVNLMDTDKTFFEESSSDSGIILRINGSHSTTWKVKPDNSFSDQIDVLVSSSFRENLRGLPDPFTEDPWVEMKTVSVQGDFQVPFVNLFQNPIILLSFIGGILFLLVRNKKKIASSINKFNSSANNEKLFRIAKSYQISFGVIFFLILLSFAFGGFFVSDSDSVYSYRFELETSADNLVRGEEFNFKVKMIIDDLGDFEDFHDISITIIIEYNNSDRFSSTSPSNGRIDNSGVLYGDRAHTTTWRIFPDNSFPDAINLYLESTFRLDKSGGLDPRIVSERILLGTFDVLGSTTTPSTVYLEYTGKKIDFIYQFVIVGLILLILAAGYVKKYEKLHPIDD